MRNDRPWTIAFGPVPSRRWGRSLGINHVPAKTCSYACVYCQLGGTTRMGVERRAFYPPERIGRAVEKVVERSSLAGEPIDVLTFVPDGEPTLDLHLGEAVEQLRPLRVPIAVITNSSLLWRPEVRCELAEADFVSVKVDAGDEAIWRRVNRPHPSLAWKRLCEGARRFAEAFRGKLTTETMLVAGINDGRRSLRDIAALVAQLEPDVAYIAAPTRPPALPWVEMPRLERMVDAHETFARRLDRVELLIGYEGDDFAVSDDAAESLLAITAVHPMRTEAVEKLLRRGGAEWSVVEGLMARGDLIELEHNGRSYIARRLPRR